MEIMEGAAAIEDHPFEGNTAFIMGNEGDGLSEQQKGICDSFVYIRQYGAGTASLNVTVAASIVMHHFGLWAGYEERGREGEKYVLAERRVKEGKRGMLGRGTPGDVRAARDAAREAAAAEGEEEQGGDGPALEWDE